MPDQDLRVPKSHAIYLDGVLMPVGELINDHSIIWDDHAEEVELYHIQLSRRAVLIADGTGRELLR